ncbi:MAG: hypothetical protein ABR545_11470 [Cyclonatronaceae bacterium]
MNGQANKMVDLDDLHLVWDSLLYLIGEADVFHASVLERLHIIETTLKGTGGDAVQLGNAINRRAETSGLAKGLLLLNQVLSNPDKRYLLGELQEAQNGILKRLQDLRKTFANQEEKVTAPSQSECNELAGMTNPVREAIDDHCDILRSAVYTLVSDSISVEMNDDQTREVEQYYEELLNIKGSHNFRHEATGILYEDWINYIETKLKPSQIEEIKEIDLKELGDKYSASMEDPDEDYQDEAAGLSEDSYSGMDHFNFEKDQDIMIDETSDEIVNRGDIADSYLSGTPETPLNKVQQSELQEAMKELSGKVVLLDRDLSKTLNDINVRLDMITFGAKEKKITTVYRNESEVINRLDSTEKRLEDRLKKMEKKLEEYNAELEFKMKRTNRQFDKQISDVIKSEVVLTDKIDRLEEKINTGVLDADQKKMLQTSDRRFSLVENQLNQIEKNFSIFKNLLEAKYNQRLEQAEQKYVKMRETLNEDVNHLKEQFIDSVKRSEFKNFEIEEKISNKLDEIKKLLSEKK